MTAAVTPAVATAATTATPIQRVTDRSIPLRAAVVARAHRLHHQEEGRRRIGDPFPAIFVQTALWDRNLTRAATAPTGRRESVRRSARAAAALRRRAAALDRR